MRATLIFLFLVNATLAKDAPPSLPPATILSVAADKQTEALVVRYEIFGTAHEQRLVFPGSVSDFRYRRWDGFSGIAIVARTGGGWTSQYFYSAFRLTAQPAVHQVAKISGPAGDYQVLGIGTGEGDSLMITGARDALARGEPVSGWLYLDKHPSTDRDVPESARGRFTTFDLPTERPATTQ